MKNWSKYQKAIFSFIEDESAGNAVVEAVAGSGKSTTIVEGMNRIPKGRSAIFLAFNKAIADIQLKAICAVFTAVGPVFLSVIHCDLFTICNIEVVLASLSE